MTANKDPFVHEPHLPSLQIKSGLRFFFVLLGLAVVPITVRMLRPQMDERLYARYRALPLAEFLGTRSTHPLAAACTAFNLKQYSKALPLFLADTTTEFRAEKNFFAALCQLELNQIPAAEAKFGPLAQAQGPWQTEAIWYLALAHLRRHDRPGCTVWLKELEGKNGRHERDGRLANLGQRL